MKNFIRFYLVFSLIIVAFSCSEDDDSEESQIREGGEIFTSQLVTINYNGSLQDEYTGILGSFDVDLIKTTDNELVFLVPSLIETGNVSLRIPGLNDLQINYTIQSTILLNSADDTINEMLGRLDLFVNGLEAEDANDLTPVRSSFSETFDTLTNDEKEQAALFYAANSDLINGILEGADFSRQVNPGLSRSINITDTNLILKFKVSGVAFSAGVALAILGVEPIEKGLGAVVAIFALKKFNQYKREIDSRNLKVFTAKIDGIASALERNANTDGIEFSSGQEKTLAFEIDRRDFVSSDTEEGAEGVIDYMKSFDLVRVAIDKLNQVITFVNDNLLFSDIALVNNLSANDETLETTPVNANDYEGFEFSVTNSNVEITSISFQDGELKLTLSIVNDNIVENGVVNTSLRYTYNDIFNSIAGNFDISVQSTEMVDVDLLIATWYLVGETENGVNTFDTSDCNITVQFTENQLIATEFFGDSCEFSDVIPSNYEVNGNIITETADGDTSFITILELTPFKMVLQEVDGSFTYIETYTNIFGGWSFSGNSNCVVSNGDTFTDNGSGEPLTLNNNYTVVFPDDSNGNYLTNGFTFENYILTINLSYQDFFSPSCGGVSFQTAMNSMTLIYDNASNTFTGTSQSSRNDVIGSDCSRLGETCTGTVSMTR